MFEESKVSCHHSTIYVTMIHFNLQRGRSWVHYVGLKFELCEMEVLRQNLKRYIVEFQLFCVALPRTFCKTTGPTNLEYPTSMEFIGFDKQSIFHDQVCSPVCSSDLYISNRQKLRDI